MSGPVFACRRNLAAVQVGGYEEAHGGLTFVARNPANLTHAGLVLDKLLPGHDDESNGKRQALAVARLAAKSQADMAGVYAAAFVRRCTLLKSLGEVFDLATPHGTRLVIGLGSESPLETGLRLHHTYGVPFIPGSALKGLVAHYCDAAAAARSDDDELRREVIFTENGQAKKRTGKQYELLFGNTAEAGFVVFHDAWIAPASLARDDEGLLPDVMTPHHDSYYGEKRYDCREQAALHGQRIPPTDFDDPVPVSFLSVRGSFQFALSWNDGSPLTCEIERTQRTSWLAFARSLLIAAIGDWGVGGKTSSGYGRLTKHSTETKAPPKIGPGGGIPIVPPKPKLPAPNEQVAAVLLAKNEKAGGKISWRAMHVATGISGPIQNSADVPSDAKVGDEHQLVVAYAKPSEIAFKFPTPAILKQIEEAKHKSRSGPPRGPHRR